jgi:hypothetical protein
MSDSNPRASPARAWERRLDMLQTPNKSENEIHAAMLDGREI